MSDKMLITTEQVNAIDIFVDGKYLELLEFIKDESKIENPDVTTGKGRALIRSMAAKVASSKVFVIKAGKTLADAEKKKIEEKLSAINTSKAFIEDCLVYLKDAVREPLTTWEIEQKKIADAAAEAERLAKEKLDNHIEALELDVIFDEKKRLADEKEKNEAESKRLEKENMRIEANREAMSTSNVSSSQAVTSAIKSQGVAEAEALRLQKKAKDDVAAFRQKWLKEIGVDLDWNTLRDMTDQAWSEFFELKNNEYQSAQNQKLISDERARVAKEAKEKREADDARAADINHRKDINNQILSAMSEALVSDEGLKELFTNSEFDVIGKKIIISIIQGKIPHISIKY